MDSDQFVTRKFLCNMNGGNGNVCNTNYVILKLQVCVYKRVIVYTCIELYGPLRIYGY